MNTKAGTPTYNNTYYTKIIETYHGDEISAELFESVVREDLTDRHLMKPELPFGVCVFYADSVMLMPESLRWFPTLDAARAHFETIG